MCAIACLKASRSSATWIEPKFAPIISTPYLASVPRSHSATARFSAVCPPTVGRRTSGRSRAMTSSSVSGISGSM